MRNIRPRGSYNVFSCTGLLRIISLFILSGTVFTSWAPGQPTYTATQRVDLQLGGTFVWGHSSNTQTIPTTQISLSGFGAYITADTKIHFGAELNFRRISESHTDIYEQTYELGLRYVRHYGHERINPYMRIAGGRGVYNYHNDVANLAYNLYSGGAGVDAQVTDYLAVRIDYEYQRWLDFPRGDLQPGVVSIGIAYHVPAGCRSTRCRR